MIHYSYFRIALLFWSLLFFTSVTSATENENNHIKGIYVTQYNLENTAYLKYLIKHAKAAGIDTFVVDLELPSKRYQNNIALLKENGLKVSPNQMESLKYCEVC